MTTLAIELNPEASTRVVSLDPNALVEALRAHGYWRIEFVGVERFKGRYRDGTPANSLLCDVEHDVEFLCDAYHALMELPEGSEYAHVVYLFDGCFEIRARVTNGRATVCVGEYGRDRESALGVEVAEETYRALWRAIGGALASIAKPG